jgi:twitching motility protein PilT
LSLELVISQRLLPLKDWSWKIAAREIMFNNSAISNLIRENKVAQIFSVIETSMNEWMCLMEQSLAFLVAQWKVDLNIALSYVKNKVVFKNYLEYYKTVK